MRFGSFPLQCSRVTEETDKNITAHPESSCSPRRKITKHTEEKEISYSEIVLLQLSRTSDTSELRATEGRGTSLSDNKETNRGEAVEVVDELLFNNPDPQRSPKRTSVPSTYKPPYSSLRIRACSNMCQCYACELIDRLLTSSPWQRGSL
ncbi:uncharacterized [Tachysurus ichikawai]